MASFRPWTLWKGKALQYHFKKIPFLYCEKGKDSIILPGLKNLILPGLKNRISRFNCAVCQWNKQLEKGYGYLPERVTRLMPWDKVAVDLIGPWKLTVNGRELEFLALTCIAPVTNITELILVENKSISHVAQQLAFKIPQTEFLYPRQG